MWMLVFPIGFFALAMFILFVVLPKTHSAVYDADTREWKDCTDADELKEEAKKEPSKGARSSIQNLTSQVWFWERKQGIHHFVNRFGEMFMAYKGIWLAQIFVTLQLSQMLVVGLLTGLLNSPVLATVQAWLVTVIAVGLFIAMTIYSPLVDPSPYMTIRENVNNSFQLGIAAASLLLVVLGPYFAEEAEDGSDDSASCGGARTSNTEPLAEINRGVMLCSLLALAVNMAILFYDSFVPIIVAAWGELRKAMKGSTESDSADTVEAKVSTERQVQMVASKKMIL
jgi:hypothetical protein